MGYTDTMESHPPAGSGGGSPIAPPEGQRDPQGTTVMFIVGMGRSGTTLLELLLGRLEGWVAGGELSRYWHGDTYPDWICGCGRLVSECEFWGVVRSDLRAEGIDAEERNRFLALQRSHLRLRPVPVARLLAATRAGARPDAALQRYQAGMATLYRAVARAAGARLVVDSSKQPPDAYLATQNPSLDVHVVHLVRDPRAVAYSFGKRVAEPQPDLEYMPRSAPFGTSVRWTTRQGFCEALLRPRLGDRYMRLRYEDLVREPVRALRTIAGFAGEPDADLGFMSDGRAEFEPNHTFSGNPLRLREEPLQIRPDESWRAKLSTREKLLATAPALPMLGRYGYRRRPE
jgi:Sulfotransferase family